ncbi:hypothetical protein [Bullifex porci]|uniref:hypothetical protein n=1 Tax=Bullifex porci TaxID=2606638 RepID=UPI0023F2AD51|nr:hypothetical protein [Bullifex porci]MDD7254413.1 hypothetical protein [Bullifex porci]
MAKDGTSRGGQRVGSGRSTENIQIYILYTEKEILEKDKLDLESWFNQHDYIGIKIATGRASVEEYAEIIEEMKVKANRINELNELLKGV